MAFRLSILAVVVLLILSAPAAAQNVATATVLRATVILEQPRGDSPVVASVRPGVVLSVVGQRGDWYLVLVPESPSARRGWVHRQTVQVMRGRKPVPPASPQAAGVTQAPTGRTASSAPGQTVTSRGFVVLNAVQQFAANNFTDGATKRENAEDGRFDTTYVVKSGPAFDVAAGAVVWRQVTAAVGVSQFTVSTPGAVTAAIPHPFFFNRPRSVGGDVAGLKREELAIHIQARSVMPVGTRVQVMLFGGPSFFHVKQTMVTDYTYNESYPYDAATFRSATTTDASVSAIGFSVGTDVAFFFTRQVGLGATVQFAGAHVDLPGALGTTIEVKAGGGQAGAGLRLRF